MFEVLGHLVINGVGLYFIYMGAGVVLVSKNSDVIDLIIWSIFTSIGIFLIRI